MIGSLNTNFKRSAKLCKQAERPNDIGTAPQLHRGPDLAVGEQDEGDADQKDDEQDDALDGGDKRASSMSDIVYSAAIEAGRARAREHSSHDARGSRDRVRKIIIALALGIGRGGSGRVEASERRDGGVAVRRRNRTDLGEDADIARRASCEARPGSRRAMACRARPKARAGSPNRLAPSPGGKTARSPIWTRPSVFT